MRTLFAIALLLFGAATAAAQNSKAPETVEADISAREISIASNFTGVKIVIFGAIDRSRQREAETGLYDVIMVIRGPQEAMVTRRKERVAGIWINKESRVFKSVPTFYAVLSSRPLSEIASPRTLEPLGIGFETLHLGAPKETISEERYRRAVIRLMQKRRLFQQDDKAVEFIGRALFRGSVDLPVSVAEGEYKAEVFLFRAGQLLSRSESDLQVSKVGLERFVHAFAFTFPFSYGLVAVMIAVAAGLLGAVVFRRD